MSSSSSARERPARRLLGRALEALAREAPAHHALLREPLRRIALRCAIADEVVHLSVAGARIRIAERPRGDAPAAVEVRAELRDAVALLDGELTFVEAVREGRVDLLGPPAALLDAADAFAIFLHGLVRCSSAGALLDELRGAARSTRKDET